MALSVIHFRRALNKPYYVFRPAQLLKRLEQSVNPSGSRAEHAMVELPWGLAIRVRPGDLIGGAIYRTGLYDPTVSETLFRLTDPGEVAVDVGANIGYMTSLLAARVAARGRVVSFEPHPGLFRELAANTARWQARKGIGSIELHEAAASNASGTALLVTSSQFELNRGTASLEQPPTRHDGAGETREVPTVRLDEAIGCHQAIGLLKVDAEGHELMVLEGADRCLAGHRIRDIVFEEHRPCPNDATETLARYGYALFRLSHTLLGPQVSPLTDNSPGPTWDAPSYLATLCPDRARARLGQKGWAVLGVGPSFAA